VGAKKSSKILKFYDPVGGLVLTAGGELLVRLVDSVVDGSRA
jgi:hypothetical protein